MTEQLTLIAEAGPFVIHCCFKPNDSTHIIRHEDSHEASRLMEKHYRKVHY